MADLATLLQDLQPRRRTDPLDQQRKYAQLLMQQGSSVEPVRSPLQGAARALQGGLAGLLMGNADSQQKEQDQAQIAGLTAVYNAKTPEARDAALGALSKGGNPDFVVPILGQLLTQKMALQQKHALATDNYNAMGDLPGSAPPQGAPATPGMPSGEGGPVINITPQPRQAPNTQGAAQSSDAQRAMQFLVNDPDLKMAPHQAAGLVGNLYRESTMSPGAVNPRDGADGSNSVGLAQWNADRAQKLQQFAQANKANPGDFNTQMQFLKSELLGSERPQFDAIRQTGSVDDAAAASVPFFRPRDTQTAALNGTQYADAILRGQPQGAPQGFTPTNVGAADVSGARPQMPPQVAQGSADPSGNSPPSPQAQAVTAMPARPQISPQAAMLEQLAQQALARDPERAQMLRQEAQKAQAAYLGEVSKTADERTYKQQEEDRQQAEARGEHDRRQRTATMSREQSDAATFADRMEMANRTIGQLEGTGQSVKGKALDTTVFGVGIPGANFAQSPEYRQFKQARENFAYAQLRRETGAAIQPFEYETIDKQYIPQPGDDPATLAQKAKNRQVSLEGMSRAAGPTYQLNPTVNKPAPGASAPATDGLPSGDAIEAEIQRRRGAGR